jgi:polysaccharide biosynthesis transport protein
MSRNYELLRKVDLESAPVPLTRATPIPRARLAGNHADEVPLTSYFRAAWRRRWIALGTTLFITAVVGVASLIMRPIYQGVARVAIYRENQGLLTVKQDSPQASEDSDYTVTLDTQAKVIEGDELATQVIRKMGLDKNPRFANGKQSVAEAFHDHLRVVKVPHTRLLEIQFSSTDPKFAADVANATANAYIDHTFQVRYDATMQATRRLADELTKLRNATNGSEAKLINYQRTHKTVSAGDLITSRLADLNKDLTTAEVERTQKQSEYNLALGGGSDQIARAETGNLLERLRDREAQLAVEYAKATGTMGPNHPQVLQLKKQLDQINESISIELNRMRNRAKNEYLTVVQREAWLRTALENGKREATERNQDAIEYDNLKREADTNRQLYTSLLEKLKEAELAAGLKADNIRIEAYATVPTKPFKPDLAFNLGMALFAGLIIGIVASLILDNVDSTVRNTEQAEIISGMPALATIPKTVDLSNDNARRQFFRIPNSVSSFSSSKALAKPGSTVIEFYRGLRSLVLFHFSDQAPRVLLITSPLPGEGKTTTATNAAIAFAQNGKRVLLVDADLRKPSIHKPWGVDPSLAGLTTVLRREHTLDEAIFQCPIKDNLSILPSGPLPADPAELLTAEMTKEFVTRLRQQFSYVIIDSPPILSVPDTLMLAAPVDAVLLVIREASTPKAALARTCDLLSKTKVPAVGIVVNEAQESLSIYYGRDPYRYSSSNRATGN